MSAITSAIKQSIRTSIRSSLGSTVDELRALITSLFGNGEQGAFYIPQPVVNGAQALFQGSAGTVPVTSDGDPVGRELDQSGNGNHATQSVSGSRPVFPGLVYDGIDDFMSFNNVELNGAMMIAAAVNYNASPGISMFLGSASVENKIGTTKGNWFARVAGSATALVGPAITTGTPQIVTIVRDASNIVTMRVNGVFVASNTQEGQGDFNQTAGSNISSSPQAQPVRGKLNGLIIVAGVVSLSNIEAVESYLAEQAGVTL